MYTMWQAVSTLDRMLDDVMGSAMGTATNYGNFTPAIDVRANDTELVFLCDVPGIPQDNLEITLENHVLTLKGTRTFESKEDEQVMLGRAYGSFTRSFTLPDSVDESQLSADLADGILTIRIPKNEKARPRQIQITASPERKQLDDGK